MNPIQECLSVHGVWNGALERNYIKAQQKPAPPIAPFPKPRVVPALSKPAKKAKIRQRILDALEGWMTSHDVAIIAEIDYRQARQGLAYLVRAGVVRTKRPNGRGNWRQPQQYRVA